MGKSQKGGSQTTDVKAKKPMLDEEIGDEFLSTWKSTAVGDDELDFSCESNPQGKKKTFNFDKMDMDFMLDGDFKNISSFKVDMSDLDFSSPPRKAEKPKEKSGKESILGKQEGKHNRFAFSFDFNELDGLDLDTSLQKEEKKSGKCTANKTHDFSDKNEKSNNSRSNSATSIDAFESSETKKLQIDSASTSKFDHFLSSLGELDAVNDGSRSTSPNLGNRNVFPDETLSPEKKITVSAHESRRECNKTERHEEQAEITVSTEPCCQNSIQDLSLKSVPVDDSAVKTVLGSQAKLCSLDAEVNTNPGKEWDDSVKLVASPHSRNSSPVNSFNLKYSSPLGMCESENTNTKFKNNSDNDKCAANPNIIGEESEESNKDCGDTANANVLCKQDDMKNTTEEQRSISKVLLSPLCREPKLDKLIPIKERETATTNSKFLNKSVDTDSHAHLLSMLKKKYTLCDNKMENMSAAEKSQELRESEALAQNQKVGISKSYIRPVTRRLPVTLESEENDNKQDTSGSHVHPAKLSDQKTTSGNIKNVNPKFLVSSFAPKRNSENISVEKNKVSPPISYKQSCDTSSLKISRITASKTETSTLLKDLTSTRQSLRNMGIHVNVASKMALSAPTKMPTLLSPPLKRKSFEGSNADAMTVSPLRRATESPTENRKTREDSQRVEEKRVPDVENLAEICKDACFDLHTSTVDVPLETSMMDSEISVLLDHDENIEKAEACAKELEDMCNMLKKKHEEVKELLVRAVVNNNLLLMLNHPKYEEKIRMIQRKATSFLSKHDPQHCGLTV